ncbi:MAG: MaoC family dehydratase [Actinobacteria bacterium]|nr:MaoC family dehydratase [Actinomycetota bacterium]
MTRTVNIHDLPDLVGEELGPGEPYEVSQEMIDAFADATGDDQWIHTDPERAVDGPFGTTIAHGYLTLSLVPVMMRTVLRVEGVGMGINYGLNRVRFPAAVPSGSKLVARATMADVDVRDDGGYQTTTDISLTVEGADRPACAAQAVARYYPQQNG